MYGQETHAQSQWKAKVPSTVMQGVEYEFVFSSPDLKTDSVLVRINGTLSYVTITDHQISFLKTFETTETLDLVFKDYHFKRTYNPIPLWLSLAPPIIAIAMALLFKEVFSALFIGLFAGTFIRFFYLDFSIFGGLSKGLFSIVDSYIPHAMMDEGHVSIIIFSMLIGGVVNLMNKNGGMNGFVQKLTPYAKSARSAQMITWFLGIFIFFDDYANTLVVGNTMRPVTDRWKVSREKLAYIVDSTAAPIAAIAFVTTWIGAELSYIKEGLDAIGLNESPYSVFLHSLQFAFYPIFTVTFIAILIWKKREFGPMYKAERLSQKKGIAHTHPQHSTLENEKTSAWYNGVIPVMVIIVGTIAGLWHTGWSDEIWHDTQLSLPRKISEIIGNADSYKALLWASIAATIVSLTLTFLQKLANLRESMEHLLEGYKTMLQAVIVLILAWALASVNDELKTAEFISGALLNFNFAAWLLPALTFVLALAIAFATGSSWGTMAILYPLIIPAAWMISHNGIHASAYSMEILYNVISCVLAGAVLGDHISPISDTTIMSSLASSCNHISHVRTQIPYALTVGFTALLVGTIPTALGLSPIFSYIIGFAVLYAIIQFIGKRVR